MNRQKLLDALQHGSLDRETKLMIIDLLSLSDDPKLEKDLGELVAAWHEADQAIVAALLERFDDIAKKVEAQEKEAAHDMQKQSLQLADQITRNEQINKVREFIETL